MRQLSKALFAAACCAATAQTAFAADATRHPNRITSYRITILSSLGGTNSRANSINDLGIVAGYSKPAGNAVRHASVWAFGQQFDLGSLGGAGYNSSVAWPVKNVVGLVSGITETGQQNPLGETWSCGFFFATSGNVCVGFVSNWWGGMTALPTLGGYNGYAAGTNNWGETIGWAENTVHDPTCAADSDQVLQFRPVKWDYGTHRIHELPLIAGDTAGAATAINDRHQIVGISGTCDQAVGRRTATHAVLWSDGHVTDLGNIGAELWNTPGAINQRGDVVGFAGTDPEDIDGNFTHAFLKPRNGVIRDLGTLPGDISSTATGINEWGQVVGYSNDAAGRLRAFLWQDGAMVELSSLAPEFAGDLVLATDINNFGQIVGRGKDPDTGAIIAFVATPVLRQR